MPYKAIKKFEFDGVIFKIGDTVPDRLIVERLINASTLVEEVNSQDKPKVELLLETPSAIEVTVEEVKTEETSEVKTEETSEVKEELIVETAEVVKDEKPSKNKNKK